MNNSAHYRVRILGCGSSGGVPRVGGDWGACDPSEPRNRRMRSSILVDYWEGGTGGEGAMPPPEQRTSVIIDTSPDLRQQLLNAETKRIDAVIYTHDHADQSHGMDDLRALAYRMKTRIPTYMDTSENNDLLERFKYCFEMPEGRNHPPILDLQPSISPGQQFTISGPGGDLTALTLGLSHGPAPSLGFRFGPFVYTPDVWDIDDQTLELISGAKLWIVDALRYASHPTHAHADKTLMWLAKTQIREAVLTNLHIDMDYESLNVELPGQQSCAYDGLDIYLSESL